MQDQTYERWQELCQQAAIEQDSKTLMELTAEICLTLLQSTYSAYIRAQQKTNSTLAVAWFLTSKGRTAPLITTRCLIMNIGLRIRRKNPVLLSIGIQSDHVFIKHQ